MQSSNGMQDVVIIGGGPAGSTLGSYLSMAGIKNMIFDSANHPRPHVGESLVTSTTRVLKEIGFLETMEREGFVKKYGAAWHPPEKRGEFDIAFREFAQPGIDQDYTYHVDRGKLDLLLLKHAEKLGSKVYQGAHAKEVIFKDGYPQGVQFEIGGQAVTIPCKMVVDASGRGTFLGRQLNLKKKDPIFNQYAVHAWFKDVDRGAGESADYIHIYFLKVNRGWIWQIPITDKITSVGVVAERDVFKESKLDPDGWFKSLLNSTPEIARAMQNAERINEFKSEGDYSYSMEKFCGNGFLMVGDAARFVDPIFSSGVSVAMYSAKYASERIRLAFATGDFSEATFKPYEDKVRGGVNIWYEFIRLYYKLLPSFTYFISHKEYRVQVLQLLQGEVYDRAEVEVLEEMRKFIQKVENAPEGNIFKKALSDIYVN
ncbi:MAG: hypothetical protein ALAOOOJD_01380 [bacterium]|nr:hypothetical protein [bacterium]